MQLFQKEHYISLKSGSNEYQTPLCGGDSIVSDRWESLDNVAPYVSR